MRNRWQEWQQPHRHADAAVVRGGPEGMHWQAGDGLVVRMAAPERAAAVRDDPHRPQPAQVQEMQREASGAVGPAGLAVALWVRLFAPAA
jgi:hypothetical protein